MLCSNKDQIVMVNGVQMENVYSNYTIQVLKTCGKIANVVSMSRKQTKADKNKKIIISLINSLSELLLFSTDGKAPSKNPDPGHHQTHPGSLPLQPAGSGPSHANTTLLGQQRPTWRIPLLSPELLARPERVRKHAPTVIRLQEAASELIFRQTH